ncbi:transmembrane protein 40 isoform X2 [Notamacropus eugenii]|uniref:transmembrane protein 40 isoform X2 n=1 Tax=Notamacropus eugenii TaxID=9315 RepID=UPI003B67137F
MATTGIPPPPWDEHMPIEKETTQPEETTQVHEKEEEHPLSTGEHKNATDSLPSPPPSSPSKPSSPKSSSSSSSSSSSDSNSDDDQLHGINRKFHPDIIKDEPGIKKNELQLYGELRRREVVPSDEPEVEDSQERRMNIEKDDEFFHFVLLCFAVGSVLVCYHYYTDWFMSLGVGLLTFASLETVGIYFGLVYRIHRVLQGFIPLFQKIRQKGFRKSD